MVEAHPARPLLTALPRPPTRLRSRSEAPPLNALQTRAPTHWLVSLLFPRLVPV